MERHEALKTFLDVLFQTEDLNSWTGHKNHRGFVVTLRFTTKEAMLDQRDQGNTIAYKRKTPYQIKRDSAKLELFCKRKHIASPNDDHDIENARIDSCDDENLSEPGPSISPVSIKSEIQIECSSSRTDGDELLPISSSSPVNPHRSAIIQEDEISAEIHSQPPETQSSFVMQSPVDDNLNGACNGYCGLDSISLPSVQEITHHDLTDSELCSICDAIAPHGTVLQTCESCKSKLCGHCALTQTFKHDATCNLLRPDPPDPPDNPASPPEAEPLPIEARPRIDPLQGMTFGDRRTELFFQAIRACTYAEMPDMNELFGPEHA